MTRRVVWVDGKKVMWNEIDNPDAYFKARDSIILARTQEKWQRETPRALEIISAIGDGRKHNDYGDFNGYEDGFMGSMAAAFDRFGKLTEKQCAAILKGVDARAAKRAQWAAEREAVKTVSQHVGTVGERREFTVTCLHRIEFESIAYGVSYIYIMQDENKNKIIYKGSKALITKGDTERIKATIKEHGERDGEKQTIITRPANI